MLRKKLSLALILCSVSVFIGFLFSSNPMDGLSLPLTGVSGDNICIYGVPPVQTVRPLSNRIPNHSDSLDHC